MRKIIVYTVLVFLLVSIIFSMWFIWVFGPNKHIGIATLRNIVIDRAILISIPVSLAYFAIHTLIIKVKNKWLLTLAILMILVLLYAIVSYFYLFHIIIVSLLQDPFVD